MTSKLPSGAALLANDIKAAFLEGPPPPVPEGYENYTSDIRARNYSETVEETERFLGKQWSEITLADFHDCTRVFAFLPANAFAYYLGTYMWLTVEGEDFSALCFEFILGSPPIRRVSRKNQLQYFSGSPSLELYEICRSFSDQQKAVFIRYLDLLIEMGEQPDEHLEYSRAVVAGEVEV